MRSTYAITQRRYGMNSAAAVVLFPVRSFFGWWWAQAAGVPGLATSKALAYAAGVLLLWKQPRPLKVGP